MTSRIPENCSTWLVDWSPVMTGIDLSHFQLTFADEFDSFDWSPDGSHGWRTTLDWGNRTLPPNHEAQYYSDSSVGVDPFYLHDGVLDITATAGSNPLGLPYNSGVITTQNSFSQLYGYFEMRAQLPAGAGLWPAFWLLPADHSWPPELDVFEVLGSDPTTAFVGVHSVSTGAHTAVGSAVATADLSEGFHTFGVNWKPDIIQWYIDGVEVAEAPTPDDMHQPPDCESGRRWRRQLAGRCRPVRISGDDVHQLHPRLSAARTAGCIRLQ